MTMQLKTDTAISRFFLGESASEGHHDPSSYDHVATEPRADSEEIVSTKTDFVEMLGVVPIPSDAERCAATSKRSGKRCKRYSQAGSSVCSKHAKRASSAAQPVGRELGADKSGLGKPNLPGDGWPWSEEEWRPRFDQVNTWIFGELEKTNPELSDALWEFFSRVETELLPYEICDVARWLRDVLEGSALIAEEGLKLTGSGFRESR